MHTSIDKTAIICCWTLHYSLEYYFRNEVGTHPFFFVMRSRSLKRISVSVSFFLPGNVNRLLGKWAVSSPIFTRKRLLETKASWNKEQSMLATIVYWGRVGQDVYNGTYFITSEVYLAIDFVEFFDVIKFTNFLIAFWGSLQTRVQHMHVFVKSNYNDILLYCIM